MNPNQTASAEKTEAKIAPTPLNITISKSNNKTPAREQAEKKGEHDAEWATAMGTWALAGITAILAVFTYLLWRSTLDQFLSANRPKIHIRHVWATGELWTGKELVVHVQIVNVGLTGAKLVQFSVKTETFMADRPLKTPPVYGRCVNVSGKLESGQSQDLASDAHSLDEKNHDDIRNGRLIFYCFGYVKYEDIKGRVQTTAFCRRLQPPANDVTGAYSAIGNFVRLNPDSPEAADYEYED